MSVSREPLESRVRELEDLLREQTAENAQLRSRLQQDTQDMRPQQGAWPVEQPAATMRPGKWHRLDLASWIARARRIEHVSVPPRWSPATRALVSEHDR